MDRKHLKNLLATWKEPAYREKQILTAVYNQCILSWEEATALSKGLREALKDVPLLTVEPVHTVTSKNDGTVKTLFKLQDGKEIEAVLIPNDDFRTVCVSSQVGCAMKCSFCATGTLGLSRNLTVDEIADQVLYFARLLKKKGERVSNVVFMGMGEPFQNTQNVFEAIEVMQEPHLLGIGARKISISTCGVVPGIDALADFPMQVNLAISLHAPTDDLRSELMPVNKAYSIGQVLEACRRYMQKTNRKVIFEYVMLAGVNDHLEQAQELATVLREMKPLVHVNLIPFHQSFFSYKPTARKAMEAFRKMVEDEGVSCVIRHSSGIDIDAACGQLALQTNEKKSRAEQPVEEFHGV